MCTVRALFQATQKHLFWGSAITPDLITSWWCVPLSVALSLSPTAVMGRERETCLLCRHSLGLFVCALASWCPVRGEEEGWTVTVELCEIQTLMFDVFTSSHNQLLFFASIHLSLFVNVLLFLYVLIPLICFLHLCCCSPPICLPLPYLQSFFFPLYSACPESFNICSLWDKKNNPEPWNKLDPTYQYKVTTPQSHAEGPHACSF